jgi:DNA excision repair protein ERCC-4
MLEGKRERGIIVYADVREEKSSIPDLIEKEGLLVVRKQLPIGDYIISDKIIVERKTAPDFAHSLFDGRLFDQAARMIQDYPVVVYIVEGNPFRLRRYRDRMNQLTSAMVTLAIDFNARILLSEGPYHSAMIIASLAKRLSTERRPIVLHKKPRLSSIREWQLYIVESFPGIGAKTAEKILEYFGTIEKFVNASMVELSKIPGVGEKRAELIKMILKTPYKPETQRKKRGSIEDFLS